MNMTLAQKKSLEALVETGKKVWTVAYDPTIVSSPVVPANSTQFYREDTPHLVEIVYVSQ